MMAARSPNADVVSRLLAANAEPNTQDAVVRTPLLYAETARYKACMQRLLQYRANVNDESLHAAARHFDHEAIQLLLE